MKQHAVSILLTSLSPCTPGNLVIASLSSLGAYLMRDDVRLTPAFRAAVSKPRASSLEQSNAAFFVVLRSICTSIHSKLKPLKASTTFCFPTKHGCHQNTGACPVQDRALRRSFPSYLSPLGVRFVAARQIVEACCLLDMSRHPKVILAWQS